MRHCGGGRPRQSQRDCVLQPRVARNELPWVRDGRDLNPNGVVAFIVAFTRQLLQNTFTMPQSLSAVYIHLVFSTKDRRPFLRKKTTRDALHAYLGGVSKQLECPPIIVGGVEDHVHLLCRFGRTITQAEWVKELKRVSNPWLQKQGPEFAGFEWQGGYSDFSVSQSNLERVTEYIANQEEHHRKTGFQDELRALLRRHQLEWDERHLWD